MGVLYRQLAVEKELNQQLVASRVEGARRHQKQITELQVYSTPAETIVKKGSLCVAGKGVLTGSQFGGNSEGI